MEGPMIREIEVVKHEPEPELPEAGED